MDQRGKKLFVGRFPQRFIGGKPANFRVKDRMGGNAENQDAMPLFFSSDRDFDNLHGVIAENINDLHRDFTATRLALLINAFQLKCSVFFCTEGLPFIFKNVIACPDLFIFVRFFIFNPDNFPFGFKIEINRPIINPIRPVLRQDFPVGNFGLVLANFDDLALIDNHFAFTVFQGFIRIFGILRIKHREIGQLHSNTVFLEKQFDLDEGHIVENHFVFFDCPFIEDITGDVFHGQINALGFSFFLNIGKQSHFEFKAENIHAGDMFLAAFQNDFFNKKPGHGQIDRPDRRQPTRFFALKGLELADGFGTIGVEDEIEEILFLFFQLFLFFLLAQVGLTPI